MPPQDLPPGLYDHPLSAAIHQALASTPDSLHQLQPLDPAEAPQRLARARGDDDASGSAAPVWFDLRPYAYQREMLDALAADRSLHQRWRNLVVAATGTGKTVLAAFDVARLHADFPEQFPSPEHPPLLLIAHRKEILLQALATFRQVLRDPSFGELYVDGELPSQCDLLFITLRKSEVLFSPSTRYRLLRHRPGLHPPRHPMLKGAAVRAEATQAGWPRRRPTEPFVCLGFARYESHEGEPIWFVTEWRFADGWSARSRRRGYRAVAWQKSGGGGLRPARLAQKGWATPWAIAFVCWKRKKAGP
jgi:hypothetical protein